MTNAANCRLLQTLFAKAWQPIKYSLNGDIFGFKHKDIKARNTLTPIVKGAKELAPI